MAIRRSPGASRLAVSGHRVLVTLTFVAFTLACGNGAPEDGAGGDSTPSTSASSRVIDPCTLVTTAEAEKALGAPVKAPERPKEANIPPRLATCRYVAERSQGVAVMTVMVRQGYSAKEASVGFRSARDQFTGAEPLAGLGDDAFWVANQLNVLKGLAYLSIMGDFDRATARSLAESALRRLE